MHEILTNRMKLCPLVTSDTGNLFALRRDVEVMSFWDGPPDVSLSETKAVVDSFLSESDIRAGDSADVGFMLARECWERGLGTELMKCLIAEAQSRGLRALIARIHAGNRRSERLLLRSGFCMVNETRGDHRSGQASSATVSGCGPLAADLKQQRVTPVQSAREVRPGGFWIGGHCAVTRDESATSRQTLF